MTSPTAYRLSRSVLPSHYELALEPNIQDFTFNGEIRISLDVNDAAKSIMTTDTFYKVASETCEIDGKKINITGFAKGSGMIAPNMATMLPEPWP